MVVATEDDEPTTEVSRGARIVSIARTPIATRSSRTFTALCVASLFVGLMGPFGGIVALCLVVAATEIRH